MIRYGSQDSAIVRARSERRRGTLRFRVRSRCNDYDE